MEYRKLADSDLELSVITFGSWAVGSWMWGKTERKDAIAAIQTAYNLGVTSIDTAPIPNSARFRKSSKLLNVPVRPTKSSPRQSKNIFREKNDKNKVIK